MYLINTPYMAGLALAAFFFDSALASPIINPTGPDILPRDDGTLYSIALKFWIKPNFEPSSSYPYYEAQESLRENKGWCYDIKEKNIGRSARAPDGYKCTIYSDRGCHGWRTKEFNKDGLADLGPKMNGNGEAWRCCKIGSTNGWGYCDAKLNEGTQ